MKKAWLIPITIVVGCSSFDAADPAASPPTNDAGVVDGASAVEASVVPFDAPAPPYHLIVASHRPVGYWRFEQDAGTGTQQSPSEFGTSQDSLEATNGPTFGSPGRSGRGATFQNALGGSDGALFFVENGARFEFNNVSPFSLEAWFMPTTIDSTSRFLLFKGGGGDAIEVLLTSGDGVAFRRKVGASTSEVTTGAILELGTWHHLVAVYNGAQLLLYLNNRQFLGDMDALPQAIKNGGFTVGMKSRGSNSFLGVMDEVAVYDRALGEAEIKQHWDALKPE